MWMAMMKSGPKRPTQHRQGQPQQGDKFFSALAPQEYVSLNSKTELANS
jgi:hypothetical protein